MVMKTVQELFGIPADLELEVGEPVPQDQGGIAKRHGYHFRKDVIRAMLTFWDISSGKDQGGNIYRACMLHGPKGAGKTSFVEQWHATLNQPLLVTTGHGKMETDDLFGSLVLDKDGAVVWSDGVLVQAARRGCSLLINEMNTIEPDVLIALNDICQAGSTFVVPRTGEVIVPAPGFRVFGTQNPSGGIYMGRKEMDPSTKRRFFHLDLDYPKADVERALLMPVLLSGGMDEEGARLSADRLIKVAAAVRAKSIEKSNAADAIPETLSTDELIKWAAVWMKLYGTPNALQSALDHVLLVACESDVRKAIQAQVITVFGQAQTQAA